MVDRPYIKHLMRHYILSEVSYRPWVLGLILVLGLVGGVRAAVAYGITKPPDVAVPSIFSEPRRPLFDLLNPHHRRSPTTEPRAHNSLSGISQTLILKPDLGACQSFVNACHEGAIVTLPTDHVMQTMGAGLGIWVGGVRFEYAHGLHTGVNFVGIRSQLP